MAFTLSEDQIFEALAQYVADHGLAGEAEHCDIRLEARRQGNGYAPSFVAKCEPVPREKPAVEKTQRYRLKEPKDHGYTLKVNI